MVIVVEGSNLIASDINGKNVSQSTASFSGDVGVSHFNFLYFTITLF